MRLKPFYDGYSMKLPNDAGEMEDVGSLRSWKNLDRLISLRAFIYETEGRQVSVRLERKARGSEDGYWVAYKRVDSRLRKTYICEAYALDPWTLHNAALSLLD